MTALRISDAIPPALTGGERTGAARWARRAGWAGFLFFLAKGLAWLAVAGVWWLYN